MKKIYYTLLFLVLSIGIAKADTRYYTIQTGPNLIYNPYQNNSMHFAFTSCDPFYVKIDGETYFLVFNSDKGYEQRNLVGCGVQKYAIFEPLHKLNADADNSKLTADELKAAGIRFVKLGSGWHLELNDKKQDFSLDKISYINIATTRVSPSVRPYGSFDLYIKKENGSLKKVIGKVSTFSQRYIQRLIQD